MSTGSQLPKGWQRRFTERFEERLRLTLGLISAYRVNGDARTAGDLADCAHKLAGVAGALGRRNISDAARQVDQALADGTHIPADRLARLVSEVEEELN